MAVNKKEVEHIATLAKLKFSDSELDDFTTEMNQILKYVDKLNELDTTDIEPLIHPVENVNVFRDDKLGQSVSTEDALKNAPDRTDTFFRVPKVINN